MVPKAGLVRSECDGIVSKFILRTSRHFKLFANAQSEVTSIREKENEQTFVCSFSCDQKRSHVVVPKAGLVRSECDGIVSKFILRTSRHFKL
ncbi:MAG: hypothetical protein J6R37_02925, partial [Clostridia bacterium]|nr:hypothetical protein [Clostridia bacterium]